MSTSSFDYTVADFNYIEHADGPQRLRLFMPVGTGPFPLVVDLHGGAWCNRDLKDCEPRDLTLARSGFAVAALNFRHAGSGYPTSLVDINYAIRWLKAHAGKFDLRATRSGCPGRAAAGIWRCWRRCGRPTRAIRPFRLPDGRGGGCNGEGGRDAMAGDQPAVALPQCGAAARVRQSAGLGRRHSQPARSVLEDRGGDGGRQSDADPGARGEGCRCRRRCGSRAGRIRRTTTATRSEPFDGNEPERFATNYRKAGGSLELLYIDNSTRGTATSHDPTAAFFRRHLA